METKKKIQVMRYSDSELQIIKSTFAEELELLFAMRKLFLQMPLDAIDQSLLKVFVNNEPLMKVVRKSYLPQLEAEAPINQEVDLIMTLELKDKLPEQAYPNIMARKIVIEYLDEQLTRLSGTSVKDGISLKELGDIDEKADNPMELFIRLVARNTIISHCEMQLNQLSVLGGMKSETVEQTIERAAKNSNK